MGTLIFNHAKQIYKKALKEKDNWYEHSPDDTEGALEAYTRCINRCSNEFIKILNISELLHQRYIEMKTKSYTNYFITIRPKPNISFVEFYNQICKYIKRSTFIKYKLSFEQKGIDQDNIGNGFHCHIVTIETKWRSKGECLRDTQSSFKKMCEPNCIQVESTKNPLELVESYLVKYESQDNHKMITKEIDYIWRLNNNLKNIYTEEDLLTPRHERSIKSGLLLSWE